MRKTLGSLFLLNLLLVFSAVANGQSDAVSLQDPTNGYSFAAPAGFTYKQTNEGFGLVNGI
jgi:hypothetical protein